MKQLHYFPLLILLFLTSCGEDTPETEVTKPKANFSFEVDTDSPLTIHFTNSSTDADEYLWDFGDEEGTSAAENPSHTYAEAGEYTVSLTATGEGGAVETFKSVTVTAPEGPAGCVVKQIKETYSDGITIYSETTTITYDSQGKVIKIEDFEEGDDPESLEFTYTDGQLVKAQYYEGTEPDDEPYFFLYEGDKLSKVTFSYEEDGDTYTYEYRFIHEGNAVIKIEYWTNEHCHYDETLDEWICSTGELFMDEETELTYSSGNVVKVVDKDLTEDGTVQYIETEELTYDSKTNPLKGNLAWFVWDWEYDSYFSSNNAQTYSWEYIEYDEEGNENYTDSGSEILDYDYNEDGLPIEISEDDGDMFEITYECN